MAQSEFLRLFNAARQRKQRYFSYKGKMYDTYNGEGREKWAKEFKDNSTYAGNHRAGNSQGKLSVATGWGDSKGANDGYRDSKGNWVKIQDDKSKRWKTASNSEKQAALKAHAAWQKKNPGKIKAVYNFLGDTSYKNSRALRADVDTDDLKRESDGGVRKLNKRTGTQKGVKVGGKGSTEKRTDRPKTNSLANKEADARASFITPEGFIDATGVLRPFNGPMYARLFGDVADGVRDGDWSKAGTAAGDMALRGVEAYTTLGAPGASTFFNTVGTKVMRPGMAAAGRGVDALMLTRPMQWLSGTKYGSKIINLIPKTASRVEYAMPETGVPNSLNKWATNAINSPVGEAAPALRVPTRGYYGTAYSTGMANPTVVNEAGQTIAGNFGAINANTGRMMLNGSNPYIPGMWAAEAPGQLGFVAAGQVGNAASIAANPTGTPTYDE